jgi:flagellar biogenesis protein FliO
MIFDSTYSRSTSFFVNSLGHVIALIFLLVYCSFKVSNFKNLKKGQGVQTVQANQSKTGKQTVLSGTAVSNHETGVPYVLK